MTRSFFILLLILALILCACRSEPVSSVYTVEQNGMIFTVDPSVGTITCDGEIYRFSVDVNGAGRTTTITYPNGGSYYRTASDYSSYGGWNEDYDPERYISGDVLLAAWDYTRPVTRERNGNPALALLCLLIGALNLAFPQLAWFFKHGWAFRDAEPSALALGLIRIGGGFLVILGIILIVI